MFKSKSQKFHAFLLIFVMLWTLLPFNLVTPAFAAETENLIYQNDFQSTEDALAFGDAGNKTLEFDAAGDITNSWVNVFQKDLAFEYADKIYSGAILSFDLLLPADSTYKGSLKAQAVTKMGSAWKWTQSDTISDLSIDKFTDSGKAYKTAHVSIAFGKEIEAVQGLKSIVPCLAASNCDYNGKIYLDNVKLVNGKAPVDPGTTAIYQNDFQSAEDAVAFGDAGNKALEFDAAGDITNSWVNVFQKNLAFDYPDKIYSGATLSFDLLLPADSTYKGSLKAQAVTMMGSSWKWTQSDTISDLSIDKFNDSENGYKTAHVSIAFGQEIEAVQVLKSVVPCLAASNCDYNGKIYLDNVKLVNGKASEPGELPKVDPLVFKFDNAADITSWSDGGKYDYDGGVLTPAYSDLGAMKLDLDYSKNSTSYWSEAKIIYAFAKPQQLKGYNQFSFDFIYDPAKMTTGSLKAKLSAGITDTNTNITNETDYGNGLKKATAIFNLVNADSDNSVNSFTIGIVGYTLNYKGSVYIDNVTFSQVVTEDPYVIAAKSPKTQAPVTVSSDCIEANGTKQTISQSVKLTDDKATANTAKLYTYLKAIGKTDSVLYGHQNDTFSKAGNAALTTSDTKDVTGSISAVVGIDALALTGNELSVAPWSDPLEKRVAACTNVAKAAADQGAIITLSAHMPNFAVIDQRVKNTKAGTAKAGDSNSVGILSDGCYNFSGYTPNDVTGNIVPRIMPGQDLNYLFTGYLDMIAAFAKSLEKNNISVMFRPFHENTGSWFWWGKSSCDAEAYKNLYKYTVEYLRDVKGVHNFIYVYGPSSEATSIADYSERYPGDDYVDMVGFDMYHQTPTSDDNFIDNFKKELSIVQQFAADHNKLFSVTETGIANPNNQALLVSKNARKDWYNEILNAVAPSDASYFLLWANFGVDNGFYTPFVVSKTDTAVKGHEMLDNFIDFYNDPRSIFANEMGDFTKISATIVPNTDISGYISSPVSGSRVLTQTAIAATVLSTTSSSVKFIAKNKAGDIVQQIPAVKNESGKYIGILASDMLTKLGVSQGTLSLVVNDKIYNTINIKYNMPEPVSDPFVVDTFEYYYGENEVLNTSWNTEKVQAVQSHLHYPAKAMQAVPDWNLNIHW